MHRQYLPYRDYYSSDVLPVKSGELYSVDVEVWPTNVVLGIGHTLGLQIAGHDTQGSGLFEHTHPQDRSEAKLGGWNRIHVNKEDLSYLALPIVPKKA